MFLLRNKQPSARGGIWAIAIGIAAVVLPSAEAGGPAYHAQGLGTIGGQQSQALAVNADGVVVGWCETREGARHAFVWTKGVMTDLGALKGNSSVATAINDRGQVVGSFVRDGETRAFYAFAGEAHDLNDLIGPLMLPDPGGSVDPLTWPLFPGDRSAGQTTLRILVRASAINDGGAIAACGLNWFDSRLHGYLLLPTGPPEDPSYTFTDLGHLRHAVSCETTGLNNFSLVVGESGDRAFVCEKTTMTSVELLDPRSRANDINDAGMIVGRVGAPKAPRASLWQDGIRLELGGGPYVKSEALAINGPGFTVGWSIPGAGDAAEAMLWRGAVPFRLTDVTVIPVSTIVAPWDRLTVATDITDDGRIVGYGTRDADGHVRAFLLTPIENTIEVND